MTLYIVNLHITIYVYYLQQFNLYCTTVCQYRQYLFADRWTKESVTFSSRVKEENYTTPVEKDGKLKTKLLFEGEAYSHQ